MNKKSFMPVCLFVCISIKLIVVMTEFNSKACMQLHAV